MGRDTFRCTNQSVGLCQQLQRVSFCFNTSLAILAILAWYVDLQQEGRSLSSQQQHRPRSAILLLPVWAYVPLCVHRSAPIPWDLEVPFTKEHSNSLTRNSVGVSFIDVLHIFTPRSMVRSVDALLLLLVSRARVLWRPGSVFSIISSLLSTLRSSRRPPAASSPLLFLFVYVSLCLSV